MTDRSNIRLVVFDCDGVLVDSEPIGNRVLCEALNELGWPISLDETIRRFVGRSEADCVTEIEAHLGLTIPASWIEELWRRTFRSLHDEPVRPMSGAFDIIDALDEIDIPYCVASSGPHVKIRTTLGIVGLLPRFEDRIFSAEDVSRGKPAPDLFLYAARHMRVPPVRSLVIEDSVPGVRAGIAAGMRVIGVAPVGNADSLVGHGAVVVRTLQEAIPILREAVQ